MESQFTAYIYICIILKEVFQNCALDFSEPRSFPNQALDLASSGFVWTQALSFKADGFLLFLF